METIIVYRGNIRLSSYRLLLPTGEYCANLPQHTQVQCSWYQLVFEHQGESKWLEKFNRLLQKCFHGSGCRKRKLPWLVCWDLCTASGRKSVQSCENDTGDFY